MNADESIIYEIASEVHHWTTKYAEAHGFLNNLAGLCGIATAKLHNRLRYYGVKSQICVARDESVIDDGFYLDCHAFNLHDGIIYDVTASQFDDHYMGRVAIVPLDTIEADKFYWKNFQTMWTSRTLMNRQIRHGWPDGQIATAQQLKWKP